MPAVVTHPTPDAILAFANGDLPDAESAEVEAHVATCGRCLERLQQLPNHPLAELLHHQGGRETGPASAATLGEHPLPEILDVPPELRNHPRYRVLTPLGHGGMGAVYLAEHLTMGRRVALKVIRADLLDRPDARGRFEQEVRAASRLTHPNIVQAFDADEAGGLRFLVMEYVEGTDVARRLDRDGPLPVAEACDVVRQAALGLQHAHQQGMVHRDLKPHNLMLTPRGQVKILDFGLARFCRDRERKDGGPSTVSGVVLGTADYIAPEQTRDSHQSDIRADIYSLGCTLFQLLSGRVPFPQGSAVDKMLRHSLDAPPPLTSLRPELPAGLVGVVERMMAKEPAARYQTPAEVAAALEPFVATVQPAPARRRRWPVVGVALAAAAAAVLLGTVVFRIMTEKGEVTLKTDDPDIEVTIKKGGELVRIVDARTRQTWDLDTAKLRIGMADQPEGLTLQLGEGQTVTLKRKDKTVVTVSRGQAPDSARPAALTLERRIPCDYDHILVTAFSPDGTLVLAGGDGGRAWVWETATGKEVALFTRMSYVVQALFTPDGKRVFCGDNSGTLYVWDVASGKRLREIKAHAESPLTLAITPDGKHGLSAGWDKVIRLWDLETGTEVRKWDDLPQATGAHLSADGKQVVCLGTGAEVRVLDLESGRRIRTLKQPEEDPDIHLAGPSSSVNRHLLFWNPQKQKLWMVDYATGEVELERPTGAFSWLLASDGTGQFGLWTICDATDDMRLVDHPSGKVMADLTLPHRPSGRASISADGRYAAVGGFRGWFYLIRIENPAAPVKP